MLTLVEPHPGLEPPKLPETHYVDNRIYTDQTIFDEELDRIWGTAWLFVCHESEVAEPGKFRTTMAGNRQIVIVRGQDGVVRAFHNVCRHRGAKVVGEASGQRKSFQCLYHLWTYALDGKLIGVPQSEGYERTGLDRADFGLVPLRSEVLFGLVWVCMDEAAPKLRDDLGEITNLFEEPLGEVELETFHLSKTIINTNWKLWHNNNTEGYHNNLHFLNRKTQAFLSGKAKDGFGGRRVSVYQRGHVANWNDGKPTFDYSGTGYTNMMGGTLPGMKENQMGVANPFPDLMINVRSNVVRLDRMIPIAPGKTLVEWRGLAVKGDTPELRQTRLRHHNMFWGPMGRNVAEDVAACEFQYEAMKAGSVRYSIISREEDMKPSDDAELRGFYQEWGRRMGRPAHAPFRPEQ